MVFWKQASSIHCEVKQILTTFKFPLSCLPTELMDPSWPLGWKLDSWYYIIVLLCFCSMESLGHFPVRRHFTTFGLLNILIPNPSLQSKFSKFCQSKISKADSLNYFLFSSVIWVILVLVFLRPKNAFIWDLWGLQPRRHKSKKHLNVFHKWVVFQVGHQKF